MATNQKSDIFDKLHKLPISRSGDRAPRISLNLKVSVSIQGGLKHFEAVSVNISRSGILLAIPKAEASKLMTGQMVQLKIDLAREFFAEQIETRAEVVRRVEAKNVGIDDIWIGFIYK